MSYQRQWYAPQGWYESTGASNAPGMTPTNTQKVELVKAFQRSVGLPADGVVGPATLAAMAKVGLSIADVYAGVQVSTTTAPKPTLSPGLKTTAKVVGLGLFALTVLGVVYVARKI